MGNGEWGKWKWEWGTKITRQLSRSIDRVRSLRKIFHFRIVCNLLIYGCFSSTAASIDRDKCAIAYLNLNLSSCNCFQRFRFVNCLEKHTWVIQYNKKKYNNKESIEKTVELNLFAFQFGNWNKKRVTIERIAPVDCGKFREIDSPFRFSSLRFFNFYTCRRRTLSATLTHQFPKDLSHVQPTGVCQAIEEGESQ